MIMQLEKDVSYTHMLKYIIWGFCIAKIVSGFMVQELGRLTAQFYLDKLQCKKNTIKVQLLNGIFLSY